MMLITYACEYARADAYDCDCLFVCMYTNWHADVKLRKQGLIHGTPWQADATNIQTYKHRYNYAMHVQTDMIYTNIQVDKYTNSNIHVYNYSNHNKYH